MINKTQTQVPEKGLLNVLFGSKGAAQAEDPAQAGAEAAEATESPEEFMAALVQAQDQKDAKAAGHAQKAQVKTAGLTKGGHAGKTMKAEVAEQAEKAKTQTQAQAQAEAQALAALLAQVQAQGQGASTEIEAQAKGRQAALEAAALTGARGKSQGRTGPALVQTRQGSEQEAAALMQAFQARQAKSVAGGVPGIDSDLSDLKEAVIAAQEAAIASQRAALGAQDASLQAHEAAAKATSQQGSPVTLQPIVIQTPLAIPVEVLGVEEDETGGGMPMGPAVGGSQVAGGKPMLASQDFLAQMRAGGALATSGTDGSEGQSRFGEGSSHGREDSAAIMLSMPQLHGQSGGHLGQTSGQVATSGVPVEIGLSASGKPEIANTLVLANQVGGLSEQGGGTIRVRISPQSLGEMTIQVRNEGGRINVHFDAQSQQAREALSAAMPELRQILSAGRYDVGSLEVGGGVAGASLALSRDGNGIGFSGWSSGSGSSDWQGGQGSQEWSRSGNAWERYFDQRQSRQDRGQRGYQMYEEAMGS